MAVTSYRRTTAASTGNGSKVQLGLGGASTAAPYGIEIKAGPGNGAGIVYVSTSNTLTTGSAVATDGWPLAAGETRFVPATKIGGDANNLYAAGDTNSMDVFVDIIGVQS